MDNERVEGEYYDLGHGVNQAEALRQDIALMVSLLQMDCKDEDVKERLEVLYKYVEELSELAGAKKLESQDVGFG
jgi:hypothetical protein